MFEKILVATDGSDCAERAINTAAETASRFGSELKILSVFSAAAVSDAARHMAEVEHLVPSRSQVRNSELQTALAGSLTMSPGTASDSAAVTYQAAEKIAQTLTENAVEKARKAGVDNVTPVTRDGDAAEEILDYAEDEGVDLIVLGSRGYGTLKGLVMGSVSNKVSHLANCACLTVK